MNGYLIIIVIWSLICYNVGVWLGVRNEKRKYKQLRKLFSKGHEMDESRTWFWDDDIIKALRSEYM